MVSPWYERLNSTIARLVQVARHPWLDLLSIGAYSPLPPRHLQRVFGQAFAFDGDLRGRRVDLVDILDAELEVDRSEVLFG